MLKKLDVKEKKELYTTQMLDLKCHAISVQYKH